MLQWSVWCFSQSERGSGYIWDLWYIDERQDNRGPLKKDISALMWFVVLSLRSLIASSPHLKSRLEAAVKGNQESLNAKASSANPAAKSSPSITLKTNFLWDDSPGKPPKDGGFLLSQMHRAAFTVPSGQTALLLPENLKGKMEKKDRRYDRLKFDNLYISLLPHDACHVITLLLIVLLSISNCQ